MGILQQDPVRNKDWALGDLVTEARRLAARARDSAGVGLQEEARLSVQEDQGREEGESPQIAQFMAPQARSQQVPAEPLQGRLCTCPEL